MIEIETYKGIIAVGIKAPETNVRIGDLPLLSVARFAGYAAMTISTINQRGGFSEMPPESRTYWTCMMRKAIDNLQKMPQIPNDVHQTTNDNRFTADWQLAHLFSSEQYKTNPFLTPHNSEEVKIKAPYENVSRYSISVSDFVDLTCTVFGDAETLPAVRSDVLDNAQTVIQIINPEA